ncbi:MAG: RNA methyltransferase [Trueperaceae bacterium]|nr:RNA methyltransferase [Trueperaceae bacterium]
MSVRQIDSAKNTYIKYLVKLKDRKARDQEGKFLIEGCKEVSRALDAGVKLEQVLFCPPFLRAEGELLLHELGQLELIEVSADAFTKLSFRQNPDGLMALANIKQQSLEEITLRENALILVIDGLEKPGNVGALLRTADAVNVDAVFLTGQGTDIYNPNVIRSSVGSVFSRPILALESAELINYLKAHQVKLVATSPSATRSYWHEDYLGATAIILGTEHDGLAHDWFEAAEAKVRIPMQGMADSLNVATSGALLLYEVMRQREKIAPS